ncbi:putative leucine-rich repeat-containing protein C10orf11 -like [Scophthalmus maximus]|uniref:Putative leucine-rich repeat-containing protein C10orf11-like n=1 Tax=Scophthalmus maximus TaxID=52904 RepID=A0A2U9CDQ4_SCOMX|nr:putative leucine-rich repeat-containing protein C10orf11 -like [Scophthalmus maximus]
MAHGESSVALNGTQISYIGHDCKDIPGFLGDTYGQFARRLDLSFNQLRWSGCRLKITELNECWASGRVSQEQDKRPGR